MANLIADGMRPSSILYVAFDEIGSIEKLQDPILLIARWFENKVLAKTFNESARDAQPAYLLFDEVQNLQSWAPQTKHLVDNLMCVFSLRAAAL
jgi:predicted AAA+ superfamily ATPase